MNLTQAGGGQIKAAALYLDGQWQEIGDVPEDDSDAPLFSRCKQSSVSGMAFPAGTLSLHSHYRYAFPMLGFLP